jgi:hypothetical protein
MGYVYCAGCGMDALGAPNRAALVFCPYCVEYAQEHHIDITGTITPSEESAMLHNVEDAE